MFMSSIEKAHDEKWGMEGVHEGQHDGERMVSQSLVNDWTLYNFDVHELR
jgi:hypothetical protein